MAIGGRNMVPGFNNEVQHPGGRIKAGSPSTSSETSGEEGNYRGGYILPQDSSIEA